MQFCSSRTHTQAARLPCGQKSSLTSQIFFPVNLRSTFQRSEVANAATGEPLRLDGLLRLSSLRRRHRGLRQSLAEAEAEGNDREGEQVARQSERFFQIGKPSKDIFKAKSSKNLQFSKEP